MKASVHKQIRRIRRKKHVRKKVTGTPDRPRMSVFRSNKNIYVQIVDDTAGQTLVAASTMEKSLRDQTEYGGNGAAAEAVGASLAAKAVEAGIKKVVFDRNGFPYHGRIKQLAEAARKGGLEF